MTNLLEGALDLASRGTAVFPCGPDKRPRTPNGFHDATTDEDTIRAWTWDGMVGAVLPPGTLVVDVDPRNGGDKTMQLLRDEGKSLRPTYTVKTGGGGWHYYLKVPDDLTLRGRLGPGVDIKRSGKGYVIVPPSPGYRVVSDGPADEAPGWLLDELVVEAPGRSSASSSGPRYLASEDGTAYGLAALEREIGRLLTIREGGRNDALNRASFSLAQLVAGGELSQDRAFEDLPLAAERMGLAPDEIMATIASGWEAGLKDPRRAPETENPSGDDTPDTSTEARMWLDWSVEEEDPPFLCHPILPSQAYVLVYGSTEASKSMSWLGLLSEGSHLGYRSSIYSLENPAQTDRSRLRRWAPDPANLRVTNEPLDLNDPRQLDALVEREREWRTDVILIDTYSHAFRSRSEDGNAKAIEFARRVRHVMAEVGCSVVVVDHTGFSGDEPRDASAKRQQVDVAVLMAKNGEWRAGEPARFSMTNRKAARFANPFHLSGEIRDTDKKGLALGWVGDAPRWEES